MTPKRFSTGYQRVGSHTWRSIHQLRGPEGVILPLAVVRRLRDRMTEYLAEIDLNGSENLLTVQIEVDGETAGIAGTEADRVVLTALDNAGVPDWPVVRTELVREDEVERQR